MADRPGIRVTCTDLESDESESREITDDYIVVTAGRYYVAGVQTYANGTHVVTVKREEATDA